MGLDKWILTSIYCYSITESFHCLVQSVNRVQLFVTPWTAACQASLSITSSQSLLKLMSIESLMPSNHLIFCHPLSSRLQSFPASGSFQMSQLFVSDDQSIGVSASASILPVNIQDWSPLGRTGWISLQSKGLSRVFSSTTQIRHDYSYIPPHTTPPGHHLRLGSLRYTATSHHLTPDRVNMLMLLFHSSHSLPPPLCKSIPYICVSIPFLQRFINIIFFKITYICFTY